MTIDWLAVLRAIAPKGKPAILQMTANVMPAIAQEFDLSTPLRQAHFLAQLAHESDGFRTTVEYADGSAYEGRDDLGNDRPGDGKRFKGRGLIQLTGRSNYGAASTSLGVDFLGKPELAAQFPHAIRVAGWYWRKRSINEKADADNLEAVTRAINGGVNGLKDRAFYLGKAKKALRDAAKGDLAPAAPKDMATSKTGNSAIIAGCAGAVAPVNEAIKAAKDTADGLSGLMAAGPWVLLALVVIGAAVFIWLERRKKMQEIGV